LANRELLDRNGFPHLTDLHYMLRPADSAPPAELPSHYQTETYNAATNSEQFAQVLERTYIQTLDCPELEGLRSPREALAGHQATGRFDPNRWWLFRHQQQGAGLLLVNEHPDRELWEIVYVGVVPETRGQGLGQHMVQLAVGEAQREQRSIVLAVDTRNHVARRIYHRCGFLDLTLQSVHLRKAASPQFTNYAQGTGTGKRNS
jgi:ribosomal protein S18 acetylase RimI-like enzyme